MVGRQAAGVWRASYVAHCNARRPAGRGPPRGLPIIALFGTKDTLNMEAERANQIEATIADLRGRLAELRRYL
jgi:hypothetical protein